MATPLEGIHMLELTKKQFEKLMSDFVIAGANYKLVLEAKCIPDWLITLSNQEGYTSVCKTSFSEDNWLVLYVKIS